VLRRVSRWAKAHRRLSYGLALLAAVILVGAAGLVVHEVRVADLPGPTFAERVRSACASGDSSVPKLGRHLTHGQAAALAADYGAALEKTAIRLRAVTPPPAEAAVFARFRALIDAQGRLLQDSANGSSRRDRSPANRGLPTLSADHTQVEAIQDQLGIACLP
jgi:hypothetical protein